MGGQSDENRPEALQRIQDTLCACVDDACHLTTGNSRHPRTNCSKRLFLLVAGWRSPFFGPDSSCIVKAKA
jgi:hypothetical protein